LADAPYVLHGKSAKVITFDGTMESGSVRQSEQISYDGLSLHLGGNRIFVVRGED